MTPSPMPEPRYRGFRPRSAELRGWVKVRSRAGRLGTYSRRSFAPIPAVRVPTIGRLTTRDRDRGTPRGATPPTPPGIRVTYHGGSTGLSVGGEMQSGETEGVEIVVAQCLLDRRVS
jgi:hypothetical protein